MIPDILVRFRMFPIGISADIEKAFLLLFVAPKDRDFLRLFFPVADEVRSPKEELPCLLRFDWPKPIVTESGRGKGLRRSENKRPETRRSWNKISKIP
ncbi:hypothetical protein TNCV_250611 [Trichonephila clavipes]|nr:hypothetical protein TNCV_250611 [Trichonephila clavipes]